jgi:glycosyltransferase involved in cell wall biosynthesis
MNTVRSSQGNFRRVPVPYASTMDLAKNAITLSAQHADAAAIASSQGFLQLASNQKKVLFVLPNNNEFGGLEKHTIDLIATLRTQKDLQSTILCFGRDIFTEHLDPEWAPTVRVCTRTEPVTFSGWRRLFREFRPGLVVFCYGWIASFPWQAILAALFAGVRRRIAIQHLVLPKLPPLPDGRGLRGKLRLIIGERVRQLFGWRFAALISTKTICVSDAVRNSLVAALRFPPRRTVTVHNGISVSTFSPSKESGEVERSRLGIGRDEFLLVCAARLAEAKGIDILLQAIAGAARRGIACKCIIAGDGPLRDKLLRQAKDLHLSELVRFVGFQRDVRPYLHAASAFILTSHLEGLPLAVLEAMACGLPCIVTNVGGNAEAVGHGINGLVITPGSVKEAEDAIVRLATQDAERLQMASKARAIACESFNIDSQMKELVKVILT